MNPWLLLIATAAALLAFVAGDGHGRHETNIEWTARIEKERADAAQAARAEERRQQEEVNHAIQKQSTELARVNQRLRHDLDGLRDRPERPAAALEAPRASCQGGTGAELSRPDAGFLVGEAARADELRAGLEACYAVLDAISGGASSPTPTL